MKKEIERGDLFYYDFGSRKGSIQSGIRPVMVIQANSFNANAPTVIVAALTSVIKKQYLPSHIVLGENYGLKKPSMVLLEQVQTVNKKELVEYVGTVKDEKMLRRINAALKKTLGLWIEYNSNQKDIYCLCTKCLQAYIESPDYIIRRVDPFAKVRDKCCKCENRGWDYYVLQRKSNMRGIDSHL